VELKAEAEIGAKAMAVRAHKRIDKIEAADE
jgi:hypothetical protein